VRSRVRGATNLTRLERPLKSAGGVA
jgi:hypothetical protein